jgi:hypothetical protein
MVVAAVLAEAVEERLGRERDGRTVRGLELMMGWFNEPPSVQRPSSSLLNCPTMAMTRFVFYLNNREMAKVTSDPMHREWI